MDGLTVKDGRLINHRPVGMSGIQEAAMLRKSTQRAKKIGMIAEGVVIGNSMLSR